MQRGLWNQCKAPTLSGQTTITGKNPLLFSNSDVGSFNVPPLNHDREDAGDGTFGLSSLSKKTTKSEMQMS